jgi:hypothetical protein
MLERGREPMDSVMLINFEGRACIGRREKTWDEIRCPVALSPRPSPLIPTPRVCSDSLNFVGACIALERSTEVTNCRYLFQVDRQKRCNGATDLILMYMPAFMR